MELPQKFCDEMRRMLGGEYEAYLSSMNDRRKYGLRVNTLKITVEEFERICPFEITKIPYVQNGYYYDGDEVQPSRHPYYFAGLYYLQDPSAMTPAASGRGRYGARFMRGAGGEGDGACGQAESDGAACRK